MGFIRVGFLIAHPDLSKVSDGSVRRSTQEFNSGVTAQRETYIKSEYLLSQLYFLSVRRESTRVKKP